MQLTVFYVNFLELNLNHNRDREAKLNCTERMRDID